MRFLASASCLIFAAALAGGGLAAARGQNTTRARGQNATPAGQAVALTQEPHHRLLYEDVDIRIFDVAVPAHQSTLLEQHNNNYLFVALGNSVVSMQRPGQASVELTLSAGAVRFVRGGFSGTLTNDGDQPFRDVTIEFLNPKLTAAGCSCRGGPTDAICGCLDAPPLPPNWNLRIGGVWLAGVTLAPGATYDVTSTRTTRLLVPITPLDIMDNSIHEPRNLEVRLPLGEFHWLAPGPHKIQNLSSQPMRFVSVEFWATPKKPDKS